VIRVGQHLGSVWRALALLRILPRRLKGALYRLVARNRYRWFGRGNLCDLPEPEVRKGLIT